MNGILNEQDSHMLANSINHYHEVQHQLKMDLIIGEEQLLFAKTYNLIPFQDGIVGFGLSPLDAILDFNKNFTERK